MNVEIGAEAVLFPEKEYISGILLAVQFPAPFQILNLTPICQQRSLAILKLFPLPLFTYTVPWPLFSPFPWPLLTNTVPWPLLPPFPDLC